MIQEMTFAATLTDKYQSTVPSPIRTLLNLGKRDKIAYKVRNGEVVLEKLVEDRLIDDPVAMAFLDFLEKDMVTNPGGLTPLASELLSEAKSLTEDVEVDLDAILEDS